MNDHSSHIVKNLMQTHGIDVTRYDDSFLETSLQKRAGDTLCRSTDAYCVLLDQNHQERQVFFKSLRISYSAFFRNSLTYSVLEHIILPSLLLQKRTPKPRELRIWSAACATGQEPYSIAMLLEELNSNSGQKSAYRIFASDHNEAQVKEAQKGQFTAEALNNLNLRQLRQWFTRVGDIYSVRPALKKNIAFSLYDLFDMNSGAPPSSIFGDFDLVVCANLLFYYKPAYRTIILEKTAKCLAPGGYLIAGEAERDILTRNNYREVFPQSAIFQSRGNEKP